MDKTEKRERLRTEIRRRRAALPPEERARLSQCIVDTSARWIQREGFHAVMLYLNMKSEVETMPLVEGLLQSGTEVCAPVVDTERLALVPRRIQHLKTGFVRHPYGMLEPDDASPRFPTERLQLIVVPGIAFDRKGHRLGYGKGFYDRFLMKCPHAVAIGLAYQIQIVENTFPQVWDIPVQYIFTEKGIITALNR